MPPKKAVEKKAQEQITERQRSAALRRILEDCSDLRKGDGDGAASNVTVREVDQLRAAFRNVMQGQSELHWSNQAVQCDNVLWQLEKEAKANPDAVTGDHDRDLAGKEAWKFAKIPRRRRLQTFVVSINGFFTGMPMLLGLAFYLTFFNVFTMPVMVLYWIAIFVFKVGVRHPIKRKEWFVRSRFFKLYRDYFPIRLVVPKAARKAITPHRNYLFCYHPHGVASFGVVANFATEANGIGDILPGIDIHVQTLGLNFIIPFWRELIIWAGMGDASAKTIRKTLSGPPGMSALLVVGGAEEALLASPKTNKLTLSKRKGFVKLALERGAPLVPVYAFGETNVYGNYADGRPKLQRFLVKMQKKLGFAIPLIKGRGWFNYNFGPLPHRRQIITVVGEPLDLPKIEKPTKHDVEHWHAKYCEALVRLYDENKPVYDVYTNEELDIVS
eukprot:CAMPEP_0174843822 /NCGR_PEP_ID=MMETSP1114-20130205/10767_1 /TAXON_ID=312471 /ORGANISM="Neobodo designis, Strain CCAP 1951/1" /LENGTH=442 /DNA_ID=CAMNT_0016078055 /DNA_START=17 /DNA_END=1345 /DNA_ORIENTATION=+